MILCLTERRLLALLAQRGDQLGPDTLVFASRNNTGLERRLVRAALTRAVKAAKLAAPAPTLHDLRHSHASMLIALDDNLVDVQHRLGHRKPDTTLRIYAHQWKHRDARHSTIGDQLGRLFTDNAHALTATPQQPTPLALPPATSRDRDTRS